MLPSKEEARDWTLIAGGSADEAPLALLCDSRISIACPRDGDRSNIPVAAGRLAFVQIIEGLARIGGEELRAGDGLQITDATGLEIDWGGFKDEVRLV